VRPPGITSSPSSSNGVTSSAANRPCHGIHFPRTVWTVKTLPARHEVHRIVSFLMLPIVHSKPHRSQVTPGIPSDFSPPSFVYSSHGIIFVEFCALSRFLLPRNPESQSDAAFAEVTVSDLHQWRVRFPDLSFTGPVSGRINISYLEKL